MCICLRFLWLAGVRISRDQLLNSPSLSGPFDQYPTGLGFSYFYGFLAGETSQYNPRLYENTNPIEPPRKPEEGYHLTEDMVHLLKSSVSPGIGAVDVLGWTEAKHLSATFSWSRPGEMLNWDGKVEETCAGCVTPTTEGHVR